MARILIVDDEKSIRVTLAEFLREAGHEVFAEENAAAATARLGQLAFDVVVSDIVLPGISGVELLQTIRAQAPEAQVIMMTGEPTVETAVAAVRAGAHDYLTKPIGKPMFLRSVEHAVRVKTLLDEKHRLEAANREYQTGLERMVEERTRSLRESETRLRNLARAVEQSPVSIVITDRAGHIEFVNPKFTQVSGYTAKEALGQNPRFLKSGETPAELYRQMWKTLLAGQEWRGEFHNKRKDGALFWESASISPVRDDAGEITHFIAVKEDLSEKKSLEAQFLRAQRLESIGSLASGIAHDLNNVLAPILMSVPLLRMNPQAEELQKTLGIIETSVQRAVDIVKQLLGFGRGDEERQAPLQPRYLVRDMARIARETFPRGIAVHEQVPRDLWLVKGNATQLFQVLLNLCVNARDAMPDGGALTLSGENIRLDEQFASMHPQSQPGPYVRIEVTDTGCGIPLEIRDRIFEAFFTTKGQDKGTGLGLTTTLGIVKNHGGLILVHSEIKRGTRFEVYLPATPDSAAQPAAAPPVSLPVPRGRGELILVVDDEANIRNAVERTLRQHGYEVLTAADGAEATGIYARHRERVALILTDLMMPLMDGLAFCRVVRKLNPAARIIVSTGVGSDPDSQPAFTALAELKIDRILSKPHTGETLLRAVRAVLAGSEVF